MTPEEFKIRYIPLQEPLYRVAFYMLESGQDAQDAVQDLYVRLWNSLDVLDSVNNPKAYCITLMKNSCIDRIRARSRTPVKPLEEWMSPLGDGGDRLDDTDSLKRVMRAIEKLPERHRTVLRMKAVDDLSYEEMARQTGMNNLTLRVLLSQARKMLRTKI